MKTLKLTVFTLFIFLGIGHGAVAADRPNLLIMGEDADKDTIPRDSRVFKRVLATLSNQLHDRGFNVYDETAVTLDNFVQGRKRRTDAELIDVSRSIKRPPIDVVVIFAIYAGTLDKGYTTKVRSRIEGRMLQVKSGRRLGNFELASPKEWNAKPKCNRECVLEVVGEYSKILAQDIGAVLSEKLAWMVGDSDPVRSSGGGLDSGYNLVFNGFTPEDRMAMEEYLVIFSGYRAHRPAYCGARRCEYWYESTIGTAKLTRNLQKMLAVLDIKGLVQFSGNTYIIEKITLRSKGGKLANRDDW